MTKRVYSRKVPILRTKGKTNRVLYRQLLDWETPPVKQPIISIWKSQNLILRQPVQAAAAVVLHASNAKTQTIYKHDTQV